MAEKTQYTDENAESDFETGFKKPDETGGPAVVKSEDEDGDEKKPKESTNGSEDTDGADGGDNADGGDGSDEAGGDESGNADGADGEDGTKGADEVVTVTKAQLDRLLAAADKAEGYQTHIDKLFGTTGDLKQLVKNMQEATPKGAKVKLNTEALKAMEEEYPEIGAHIRKITEGLEGTSEEKPAAGDGKDDKGGIKPEAVQAIVDDAVTRREMKVLEQEHPKWRDDVGAADAQGKFDPKHPFRVWLSKQPADYRKTVDETDSPLVVARAIDKFKAFNEAQRKAAPPKTPSKQQAARKDRLEDAVTPRGDGGQPKPKKTLDEEFDAGFKSG